MTLLNVKRYRKRPVVIQALEYDGTNLTEVQEFCKGAAAPAIGAQLLISTLEGPFYAQAGDFIVCGVNGEFYPVKPDIFAKTYEPEPPDAAPDAPNGEPTGEPEEVEIRKENA